MPTPDQPPSSRAEPAAGATESWPGDRGQTLRALVEQAPAVLWSTDAELRFTSSTGGSLPLLGLQPDQVVGLTLFAFFATDDPDFPPIAAHRRALAGASSSFEQTWHDRTFLSHVEPLRDAAGAVIGTIGVALDVTAGTQAESALRRSEEQYRLLLAAAERQARERDLLDRVRTALARELELPVLFRTVVEAIAETFGYTQVSIYLLEDDHLLLQHQVGYHRVLARIPVAQGVSGRVVRTGEPMLLEDIRDDPAFLGAIEGIDSEVCVPLHDQWGVAGTLNVESTGGVRLGEADLWLMLALSEHVNIALERARLHDRIRAGEERLRLALQAVEMGTWEWHVPSGRVTWSHQMGPLYGRPAGTSGLTSEEWFALVHPDDRAHLAESDHQLIASGADYEIEFRVVHPDGARRWLAARGRVVERDPAGHAQRVVGVTMDITARKRAEDERLALIREQAARTQAEAAQRRSAFLAEASALLSTSLDTATTLDRIARLAVPDLAAWCVVDLLDEHGRVDQVAVAHRDPAQEERLAEGRRRYPLNPDAEAGSGAALRTGRAELTPDVSDAWLRRVARDKGHLALLRELGLGSTMAVPLVARGTALGVMSFGAARPRRFDLDDLALAEELARRAALAVDNARLYEHAQAAIHARDQFLSIAAHELRTPITVIKGFADRLQQAFASGPADAERLRRPLVQIARSSDRLVGLVDDLLDVSRIRLGQLPLRPRPIDVGEVVRAVAFRHGDHLDGRHPLAIDLPDEPCVVEADADRLDQVLTNLIDNAVKYTPEGGEVRLALRDDADGVLLTVQDRGIGLPPGAADSIFYPFGRAANAERSNVSGLGLGLYICRTVVERHGGRIWADSPGEGQGTTLSVWLPRTIPAVSGHDTG